MALAGLRAELAQADLSGLPDWLKKLFQEAAVPDAPEIFNIALEWVYGIQKEFLESSPSHVLDELRGMAQARGALSGVAAAQLILRIFHFFLRLWPASSSPPSAARGRIGGAHPLACARNRRGMHQSPSKEIIVDCC